MKKKIDLQKNCQQINLGCQKDEFEVFFYSQSFIQNIKINFSQKS